MVQVLTPYEDALRYMDNAKDLLKKADKMDNVYRDLKYVKMASGTAYSAVLLALDECLLRKEGAKYKKPKSIDDYRIRLGKQNRKVLDRLNMVYDDLHISGYYIGTPSFFTIKRGFDTAYKIIEIIKKPTLLLHQFPITKYLSFFRCNCTKIHSFFEVG